MNGENSGQDLGAYPPSAFHFKLTIDGDNAPQGEAGEAIFQEASGIAANTEIESVDEGGENRFKHRLPTPAKHENLKLARGMLAADQPLANWLRATLQDDLSTPIKPKTLILQLFQQQQASEQILKAWTFHQAWPLRWEVSGMDPQDKKLLVETVEFSYSSFEERK